MWYDSGKKIPGEKQSKLCFTILFTHWFVSLSIQMGRVLYPAILELYCSCGEKPCFTWLSWRKWKPHPVEFLWFQNVPWELREAEDCGVQSQPALWPAGAEQSDLYLKLCRSPRPTHPQVSGNHSSIRLPYEKTEASTLTQSHTAS